ncbi:MAG: hypothetical protein ACR2PR_09415 [Pseudohongiellaceae bacterium]
MPAYTATFQLVDAYNRSASKEFTTVDTVVDEAAALTLAAALAADIAGLSELRVLSYTLSQRIVYTDAVTPGANRDEGVTFSMLKEDNYKGNVRLQGPINSIFDGNGNADLADAAVTAFVNNFLSGADWTFSDGEQASEVLNGTLDD